jgi:hypothetical protein
MKGFAAAACVIMLISVADRAAAQEMREAAVTLLVPGLVYQYAIFGDDDPLSVSGAGVTVGVQFRGPRRGSKAFVFEATLHLNALENPHYPERIAPFYGQAGMQIGRKIYVRPAGGVAYQSGSVMPVLSVAAGREWRAGKYLVSPELVVRSTGSFGIYGWMSGVQIAVGTLAPAKPR